MNRVCSIFAQVLRLLPRIEFEQAVQKHRTEEARQGVQLLDATDRHAVLPAGTGQIAAGDRGRSGQFGRQAETLGSGATTETFHLGLRQ